MAIAVGVFGQIILMVIFGGKKLLQGLVFYHDFIGVFGLLGGQGCLNNAVLGSIGVVHAAAVLAAAIVALAVEAGGIDHAQIVLHDVGQAQLCGVVDHFNGFGMAGVFAHHLFVGGVFGAAVGIAGYGVNHAGNALEIGFQPPKAAAGQIDGFAVHKRGFRVVCGLIKCGSGLI